MATVSLGEVRIRLHEILLHEQVPAEYARLIEDHYLGNEVLGKASHGIYRLPLVVKQIREFGPGGPLRTVAANGQSLRFDANLLPGVVALGLATDRIIDHFDSNTPDSIVAAGVTNYQFGTGVIGRFAFQLAEQGLIGIVVANGPAYVVAPGGRQPLIGTNPIAIAIPSEDAPLVVDMSTSATAYGKLAVAQSEGRSVEEGLVIDSDGNPSTDPADKDAGAMLALGDHKGFGLGLMIELLAGPLIGADAGPVPRTVRKDGALLLAIQPGSFGEAGFGERVAAMQQLVLDSALRPGSPGVRLPGERYALLRSPGEWPATIDVPDAIWNAFCAL